jgi:MFS family permease
MSQLIEADPTHEAGHGLTEFYASLTTTERRTFWACFAGWVLDGMDFMIYPLVIGTLIALWNVAPAHAGFAVTASLLASAVGGWAAGILADRIGRVRTLQITILWLSVFSLLCAFAQDFTQLTICRALLI